MALVLANRVQETTTTTGTGTVTLAGAVAGFQSFAVIGNGNTTYYTITSGNNWEVGIGTYTSSGTTLARTTILSSSNGGAAINLSGTSNVFVTYPSEDSVYQDGSAIKAGSAVLAIANGGTGATTDSGARTSLGLGTMATQNASSVAITGGDVTNVKMQRYRENVTTGSSSTSYAVDLSTANIFDITMTGNCTFTFTNPPSSGVSYSFMLILDQDATGSRTATWPASVKWPNGSTPTLTTTANKTDILNFITVDGGTTYYGALSLANM
jgi:hypothetical protein